MAQKPMTKTQLVAAFAEEAGIDKKAASEALDALATVVSKEARMVRNPSTGEQIAKPADRVAKVTIAKALKDMVNS